MVGLGLGKIWYLNAVGLSAKKSDFLMLKI